jgi:hypothetical protein
MEGSNYDGEPPFWYKNFVWFSKNWRSNWKGIIASSLLFCVLPAIAYTFLQSVLLGPTDKENAKSQISLGTVPLFLKFSKTPSPMECDVGDPFRTELHTVGTSGASSKITSTLYIVCPTQVIQWKGLDVPINWFQSDGKAYTDCSAKEDGFHRCWVTIPNN